MDKGAFNWLAMQTGGKCFWCLAPVTHETANRDHIIPVALGGTRRKNLVLSCLGCNNERSLITAMYVCPKLSFERRRAVKKDGLAAFLDRWEFLVLERLANFPTALESCLKEIRDVRQTQSVLAEREKKLKGGLGR